MINNNLTKLLFENLNEESVPSLRKARVILDFLIKTQPAQEIMKTLFNSGKYMMSIPDSIYNYFSCDIEKSLALFFTTFALIQQMALISKKRV